MLTRLESELAQTHMALTGPTMQQVLQLMLTRLESKLGQTHVSLTGPTMQQVLQLMMTRLESKLAQTHVALTGPAMQQVLQLMMTRLWLLNLHLLKFWDYSLLFTIAIRWIFKSALNKSDFNSKSFMNYLW